MTFEIQSIAVGESLLSFQPSKYQIAGMRIDNPSGSWYRVVNNGRIIPPWTLGSQMLLIPNLTSVTVEFLPQFAGQPSRIVGNKIQVMTTDEPLPDLAPISIHNTIPYAATFCHSITFSTPDADAGLFTVFRTGIQTPLEVTRLRLASLAIWMETPPIVLDNKLHFYVVGLESDSTASLLVPASRDGDQAIVPRSIVRDRWNAGTSPSLGAALDLLVVDVVGGQEPQGPWHWSWNLDGPEMPPSAAGSSSGIGIQYQASNPNDDDTYTYFAVWTEEYL